MSKELRFSAGYDSKSDRFELEVSMETLTFGTLVTSRVLAVFYVDEGTSMIRLNGIAMPWEDFSGKVGMFFSQESDLTDGP